MTTTTLCTCWRITRADATVEGYTDHDKDLSIGGVDYRAASGFAPSAVERKSDLTADAQQLAGIIDSAYLSASDLLAGVYTGARVQVFLADWSTSSASQTLLAGHLGDVTIQDQQYRAELLSLESELKKPIGKLTTVRCRADLGDSECGYSLTADAGSVTAVTVSRRVIVDTSRTEDDGWYTGGKLTWLTGANALRTMDVKRYVSATQTIELFEPMPSAVEVGDTFNIYRGCDKAYTTCRDTFYNHERFRGFPHIPGVLNLVANNLAATAVAAPAAPPALDITLSLSGDAAVDEDATYTLTYTISGADAGEVTGIEIDWGDGTTTNV